METADMDIVRDVTPYVTGISEEEVELETHHLLQLMVCM
jgi:hypothetical protein